jgi:hypothetical protein
LYFRLQENGLFYFVDKPLYYYRHHDKNISLNRNAWSARYYETIAKEHAYFTRRKTFIKNITIEYLSKEWYNIQKN